MAFKQGDKVVYKPDGKTYDFGYIGQTGLAIIYEEGECNMQDSFGVLLSNLEYAIAPKVSAEFDEGYRHGYKQAIQDLQQ